MPCAVGGHILIQNIFRKKFRNPVKSETNLVEDEQWTAPAVLSEMEQSPGQHAEGLHPAPLSATLHRLYPRR